MNAALMWKEYRQLRGVWIVVTLLAMLVLEGLLATVGSTTSWLDHLNTSRIVLISIVVCGIAAHGIVAGAMLIARDKEDGTEAFLDSLTCQRSGVWWNKLVIGLIMVILQGLVMVALPVGHRAFSLEECALLPLLGVSTLAWGVLGGALCRHVLSATLLATLLMGVSWLLAFPLSISPQFFVSTEAVFSFGALVAAQAIYCRPDQMRLPESTRHPTLHFLARNLAIVLGLSAAIAFLIIAYELSATYHIERQLLLAAELGVSVAILLMLRNRLAGWQLILLAAGLTAFVFMTGFLLLFHSFARIPEVFFAAELIACTGAALLSRVPPNKEFVTPRWRLAGPAFVGSLRSTLWLVSRQGRWVFLGAALLALVAGTAARLAPMFIWPIGSMIVGILCGLGVFCPDQKEGRIFWAGQRFPAARIWFTKVITWAALLTAALILSGMGNVWWSLRENSVDFSPLGWLDRWQGINSQNSSIAQMSALNNELFLLMWPIYGFSIALLVGQLASRAVIATTVAVVTVPAVLALWLPSFLIGGLSIWQVMVIPGLLLPTSVAIQHAWIAGRLFSLKSITVISGCLTAGACWLAGSLWHRANEVPDVGEPFDLKAFLNELPPPSETGPELQSAIRDFFRDTAHIEKEFAPHRPTDGVSIGSDDGSRSDSSIWIQIDTFNRNRWLKRSKTLAPKLDKLFQSASFAKIQRLAASPLGLIQDVRKDRSPNYVALNSAVDRLASLMDWRIGQLLESRDYSGALQLLETGLGVARQLENFAPVDSYVNGVNLETVLLGSGLDQWLQAARSDRVQLLAAQELVRHQESVRPDPAGAIKTQSIINRSIEPFASVSRSPLDQTYRRLAVQIPWEKERQRRVVHASIYGALTALRKPRRERIGSNLSQMDHLWETIAEQSELPPTFGIGSELPARDWAAFVLQSCPNYGYLYFNLVDRAVITEERAFKAARLAVALRLYQLDNHKPPVNLEELVPKYLPEIPVDPKGGPVGVDWEETDEIAGPCLVALLIGQSSVSWPFPWPQTMGLANISGRAPLLETSKAGMPLDGAGAGELIEAAPLTSGGEGMGAITPAPLFPRPVVRFGDFTFGRRIEMNEPQF